MLKDLSRKSGNNGRGKTLDNKIALPCKNRKINLRNVKLGPGFLIGNHM